jgi:hypothetical protein
MEFEGHRELEVMEWLEQDEEVVHIEFQLIELYENLKLIMRIVDECEWMLFVSYFFHDLDDGMNLSVAMQF